MKIKLFCALMIFCLIAIPASALTFTDAAGRSVSLENPGCVVSLYKSYGDAWLVSGGSLAGNIADAFEDNPPAGIVNLGSHLNPDMELLFSLDPDFVILSADVSSHREIGLMLEEAAIPHAFFSTPDWRSYMDNIRLFTRITGREDLWEQQVSAVQQPIEAIIQSAESLDAAPTALLVRAHSTAVKARNSTSTVAGHILKDMGFINIADGNSVLCESIGMEAIILEDPDYIFAILQGSSPEAARDNLASLTANPAWSTLSAVRNGRFYMLDRDLFHYHPNSRWAESYQFILDILEEYENEAE